MQVFFQHAEARLSDQPSERQANIGYFGDVSRRIQASLSHFDDTSRRRLIRIAEANLLL